MSTPVYYYVIVREGSTPQCGSCPDLPALQERLTGIFDKESVGNRYVYVFHGVRWFVSSGRNKFLFPPKTVKEVPLFPYPEPGELPDDGLVDNEAFTTDADYNDITQKALQDLKNTPALESPFDDEPTEDEP